MARYCVCHWVEIRYGLLFPCMEEGSCRASFSKGGTFTRWAIVVGNFQGCSETAARRTSASRPAVKAARFIAIEKRITTRYREAQISQCRSHVTIALNYAATFFLLSTSVRIHPPSTYLRTSPYACRPATTNEHHAMLDFGSNRLDSFTCNSNTRFS